MDCAGSPGTAPDITSVMVQQQRMAERQLAEVVKEVAVPLLEAAVAQEFPFWRGQSRAGGAAPEVQRPAGDSDECRELHGYDKVHKAAEPDPVFSSCGSFVPAMPLCCLLHGSDKICICSWSPPEASCPGIEKRAMTSVIRLVFHCHDQVDTLAHCYGFLVASGHLRWEQVEAALGRPYAFPYFWQIASSLYRIMTVYMVAVIVQVSWCPCALTGSALNEAFKPWRSNLWHSHRRVSTRRSQHSCLGLGCQSFVEGLH